MSYNNVLVATDLHSDALPIVRHALEVVKQYNAKLSIISVVPNLPLYMASGLSSVSDIEDQLAEQAKERFHQLKKEIKDVDAEFLICHGSAKVEIVQLAKDIKADLIVIGSHGRHGVQRLLGSTASGVLHRAPCDVLVVRVGEKVKPKHSKEAKNRLHRMQKHAK